MSLAEQRILMARTKARPGRRIRHVGRLRRVVRFAATSALVICSGLLLANQAGNFAVRAGIFTVMVNYCWLEVGILDGKVFPYGWEWELVPRGGGYITYYGDTVLKAPLWILLLPIIPAVVWAWLRRRPIAGHCSECDYNLTGNKSGVCPECGTLMKVE